MRQIPLGGRDDEAGAKAVDDGEKATGGIRVHGGGGGGEGSYHSCALVPEEEEGLPRAAINCVCM